MTRRAFLFAGLFDWLFFWRKRSLRMAEARFQIVRHGSDRRHYFWVHGNERTAHDVLLSHMKTMPGRAFLVQNTVRNIPVGGGLLDPNRMFSREGAEKNLRSQNKSWNDVQVSAALDALDKDRGRFVASILPKDGRLLVALHNNGPGYSVNDEVPISDAVSLKNADHPHEFMLCTMRSDFDLLSKSHFNVVLQNTAPKDDDGSLSRLTALRGIRYVNIEAGLGNRAGQQAMLDWLEKALP
ncbi:MAG: hypothetical protein ABJF23_20675 [Bryobacteraceae bacterium]